MQVVKCNCGEIRQTYHKMLGHMGNTVRRGGKKIDHTPIGLVDEDTGEVIKPWGDMAHEVMDALKQAKLIKREGAGGGGGEGTEKEPRRSTAGGGPEISISSGGKGQQSKVIVRPQIEEIPEDVVLLFHLDTARFEDLKSSYRPTFGQWLRDIAYRFHIEHPELVDMALFITEEEKAILVGEAV